MNQMIARDRVIRRSEFREAVLRSDMTEIVVSKQILEYLKKDYGAIFLPLKRRAGIWLR
jgi:hypothetical protein